MTCPIREESFSSIYLLVSKGNGYFKIGNFSNTLERLPLLEKLWGEFDLERSVEIVCNESRAYRLERTLHFIFEDRSVDMGKKNEGFSEWFDIDCLDEVLTAVSGIQKHQNGVKFVQNGIARANPSQSTYKGIVEQYEKNIHTAREIVSLFQSVRRDIKYINLQHGLIILEGDHREFFLDMRVLACNIQRAIFSTSNSQYRQDKNETSMTFHCATPEQGCESSEAGEVLERYLLELEKEVYSEFRFGEVYLQSVEDFYRKKLIPHKREKKILHEAE